MKELINTESFFSIIKKAQNEKKSFAFSRFSDGEIMLLNRNAYLDEYNWAIKKLIGYNHTEQENVELSNYLIETLQQADVIGFPTQRHLSRKDYFNNAIDVFEKFVGKETLDKKVLVSIDVCYDFLASSLLQKSQVIYVDYFEELLKNQECVNYISCRNLDNELKSRYNIKKINSFIIAPESKFTSGYEGQRHYPYQFQEIKNWIENLNCKGEICLVGGGVISKIYNIWFKNQGGISLDIGAVFDLWAGKSTRGQNRGLDNIDNTYKL